MECDRATWLAYGFDTKSVEETRLICEDVFAKTLDGHALVSNRSVWRNFPWLWNERWSFRNMVLVGDALHTAHYSIGSGTRLAMEDVIALIKALEAEPGDLQKAFALYESTRRPVVAVSYTHLDVYKRQVPCLFRPPIGSTLASLI